jgi:hypothetical protein
MLRCYRPVTTELSFLSPSFSSNANKQQSESTANRQRVVEKVQGVELIATKN